MARPKSDMQAEVKALEARTVAARIGPGDLCTSAGVHPETWARARRTGRISLDALGKLERAVAAREQASA